MLSIFLIQLFIVFGFKILAGNFNEVHILSVPLIKAVKSLTPFIIGTKDIDPHTSKFLKLFI